MDAHAHLGWHGPLTRPQTGARFLGALTISGSLNRLTSISLYLNTGLYLHLRPRELQPGPLTASTSLMGPDGPVDSRLLVAGSLQVWDRVAILLAWPVAQPATPASLARGKLPPWHSQEDHGHPA